MKNKLGQVLLSDISDMEKLPKIRNSKDLQTTIDGVLSASSDGVFVSDISGTVKICK